MEESHAFSQHTLMVAYKAFLYDSVCLPGLSCEESKKMFYEYAQNKFIFTPSQIKENLSLMNELDAIKEHSQLKIFLDGSVNVQSSPEGVADEVKAGCGFLIESNDEVLHQFSCSLPIMYDGIKTNSHIAEYESLFRCLSYLEKTQKNLGFLTLEIWSDSKNLVRQMNGDARIRNSVIRSFRDKIQNQIKSFHSVTINFLPREENGRANLLAREGRETKK